MHLQPYPALCQLVGFGIGADAVGEEDEDELLFRVAPNDGSGKSLVSKCLRVSGGGHDGGLSGRFRGVEAQTTHLTAVQRVHSRELFYRGFRQIALGVEDTSVLNHQEDGRKFLCRGEESRIAGIAVHQSSGLVVYIAVYQLFTEQIILFRRGDFIA